MEWKAIIAQGFLTLVAVVVGVKFFGPDNTQQLEFIQKSILEQTQRLDNQAVDNGGVKQTQTSSPLTASVMPARPAGIDLSRSLQDINQSLQEIIDSLSRLEDAKAEWLPPRPPLPVSGSTEEKMLQRQSKPDRPGAWIQSLPEKKRMEVEDIFKWQGENMRARFPEGLPSDPKALIEVMEKNNQEIRENMKAVLSEDEYRMFLESFPAPRASKRPGN